MHYVSVEGLTKSYGIQPLFENISFNIEEGDKIALVARNGTGKSTLLRILAGTETADEGKVWVNKDVDVVLLEQEPSFIEDKSVLDNIFFHNHPIINAIKEYELLEDEQGDPEKLSNAIMKMDDLGAWDFDAKVKQVLGKLNIHHLQQPVKNLSGGQRKRVALAKTLIDIGFEHKHVLLIMDEPTNHLDVEMVEWLEHYFDKENITLLLVTHDRYFLDAACNEIWEMEGSNIYVHKGDYQNYLEKKTARIESDSASIDKAKNTYRKELEWMRKQPKARTTKSKSRQDNFYEVEKKAKQQIVDEQVQLNMKMNRLGGKIAELKKLYKSYGEKILLKGFDYTFKKGERIGVAGKNGAGKSTFINILQGIEQPDSGKVNIGDTVVFGNYSQQGLVVKEDMRVIEFVKNIAEHFPLASGGSLSAAQFLQLFLFDPDKQYTYISKLSGGERRRLHLLSILFRNPNFLILDEPTNDLDLPTLGVLENFLSEFPGCLLIVSHDRYFMDRLVDHLFIFEGDGIIRDFPGNYTQYRQSVLNGQQLAGNIMDDSKDLGEKATIEHPTTTNSQKRQLSYKEKREFEVLEKEIADLTKEKVTVTQKLNNGNTSFDELQQLSLRIGEVTRLLDEKELRWLELSEIQ
ncbi:MAG: ABC-F family ATP-binding cassette domain-containing protein [Chitinophagaceae bacterium]|nr:ABC-F family ATP-binding cassette domain-containing protein [Chitinophagaceae bacterium]MBK7680575.1 ABC-F family ATP-binding cassette domain-containing protein [Chitinophagaceae bacterium]MBK8300625.1 ABC-F family ATP-binding cassette domain-containing protein [Chitinophagaceae bacterium]MBK9465127.1 ABC-F family ATP-binding cassette domain-containing protein [Chitinophagaceae bacterium]MBK9660922.1 ABC-F family ATP-binding cassette domain-containing protein [Chitinophagaceae bacterium]